MIIFIAIFLSVVTVACAAAAVAALGIVLTACGIHWEDLE